MKKGRFSHCQKPSSCDCQKRNIGIIGWKMLLQIFASIFSNLLFIFNLRAVWVKLDQFVFCPCPNFWIDDSRHFFIFTKISGLDEFGVVPYNGSFFLRIKSELKFLRDRQGVKKVGVLVLTEFKFPGTVAVKVPLDPRRDSPQIWQFQRL